MDWRKEWKKLAVMLAGFIVLFYLPLGNERFSNAILESLRLVKWYAREHVLLCLVPAFFIAGGISIFVSHGSVMKYLGAGANKIVAYGVAAVSGTILAVCSCTVLPLFAGIYRMGAGLGPATAFLYSGPAINALAIILTARVLGVELGIARALGAIVFSVVIGVSMHLIFRREELAKAQVQAAMPTPDVVRPLWQNGIFFGAMVGILVFANWGAPREHVYLLTDGSSMIAVEVPQVTGDAVAESATVKLTSGDNMGDEISVESSRIVSKSPAEGVLTSIWNYKWPVAGAFAIMLAVALVLWFGVVWWKVLAVAGVTALGVFAVPGSPSVAFVLAVVGLSVITSTGKAKGESREWFTSSWGFAVQILPLLLGGVLLAGFLLGGPGGAGIIPAEYVQMLVGAEPDTFLEMTGLAGGPTDSMVRGVWMLWTNLFASVFGAFMYFATLTEVPILQGLMSAGMGKGPALALLLAGPALSLPNMLVIRSVLGTKKTVVFVCLVVVMATVSGMVFGSIFG